MGEHLIKVENLTLSYENMTVVKDLSFTVESGDYLCIVGENGSGKSTLVKSLLSLKKPVGGEITFGGGLRRNEIGYLPQQTGAQHDFPASVGEVVISGCLNSMGFSNSLCDVLALGVQKSEVNDLELISIRIVLEPDLSICISGSEDRCILHVSYRVLASLIASLELIGLVVCGRAFDAPTVLLPASGLGVEAHITGDPCALSNCGLDSSLINSLDVQSETAKVGNLIIGCEHRNINIIRQKACEHTCAVDAALEWRCCE